MPTLSPRAALLALSAAALAVPAAAQAAPAPAPTTPPTAAPSTYEQISRASGATGNAKLDSLTTPKPSWVGDLGVNAAYTEVRSTFNLNFAAPTATLRNTVSNQTRNLGAAAGELLEADRLEQVGLFRRQEVVSDFEWKTTYAVGRLDGTGLRDLPISTYPNGPVALSGNGKFVVVSDDQGLRRLNLATGVWTQIAPFGYLGTYSVSDDGQSIAAVDFDQDAQRIDAVVYRGGVKTKLIEGYDYRGPGTEPLISPDGSTVFTTKAPGDWPERTTITAHRLAAGTSTTTEVPFEETWNTRPLWISPTGDRIAYALNYQDTGLGDPKPAQAWKVGGAWSTFGGAFATSLRSADGSDQPSVISRNGLFAAIAYNDQVAVASLSGLPLVGNLLGRDGLSASSFIESTGMNYCGFGFSSSFNAAFVKPAPFIAAPKKARIIVSNGATVLADQQWTKAASSTGGVAGDYDYLNVAFPFGTPHTRNVSLTVVDGNGRTVSEKQSAVVTCGATS